MRKLASIQRIVALDPITGADLIEVASVQGWKVVVKKGEFAVGDLCIYFEIDSFLPASDERFAFLKDRFITWNGKEGCRLKTIKLKKQVSQGLVLPVQDFRELPARATEGDDVTEILKIEKWEPAEEAASNSGGAASRSRTSPWPFFLQKTDQERVQNCTNELPKRLDETFESTMKLDGSSMTVYALSPDSPYYAEASAMREKRKRAKLTKFQRVVSWIKKLFTDDAPKPIYGVCSRNIELDLDGDSHFAQYVRDHDLIAKLEIGLLSSASVAFQGELIAPSIQGNYENVSKPEWYVYDVFDIDSQSYKLPVDARRATMFVDFKYVPVLNESASLKTHYPEMSFDTGELVQALVKQADAQPGMNKGVKREGEVWKSNETPFSFKIVSNTYLLKKG